MKKCAICSKKHNDSHSFVFEVWDRYSICNTCHYSPRREWLRSQWEARKNYVRRSDRNVKRHSLFDYKTSEEALISSVPEGERF